MKIRVGLRIKLLGVTLGLLAFLTLGALAAVHYYLGQQVREQAERKLRAGAHVLSSILDRTEEQLLGRGQILVELPSLQEGFTEDPEQLEPLLQEVKAVRTANLLWATDPNGVVLASTAEYPPIGETLSHRPLVAQALSGQKALGFDFFMEDWWLLLCLPVMAPETSASVGTVTLALLVGEAYLSRLAELIETEVSFVWDGHQFWSGGWPEAGRGLISSRVVSALGQPPQELALSQEGPFLWLAHQVKVGMPPLVSTPIALLGIRIDESVIQRTAQAIGWIALLVMAVGAILLVGAIRSITRPLKSLVADSQRIGTGDLTHRAQVHGADEVAELATSFNQMIDNLHRSRDELVQEKTYTDSIIHRMINSLIVVDAEGTIQIMNPSTVELLGYTEAELVGKPITTVFEEGTAPFKGDRWEAFLQQGVVRNVETTYRSKHGKKIPVLFSSAVMRGDDGHIQGVVCVAQDITERKQLEGLKDDFLSTVSHELRTPLTSIREASSLVLDESLGAINDEQRTFLRAVDKDTRRLIRLVNTLLDISAIDSGRMPLNRREVDLADLIEQTCRSYQSAAGRRKVARRIAPVPAAYGDRDRILEVLGHLLDNAIQFTPDTGTITVSLEQRDNCIAVSVTDDGVGIPREELGQLFGKFVQPGRAEVERSGGVGLGLVFCKKIVDLHGGTIWVSSDAGKGASFTFTLPISKPA